MAAQSATTTEGDRAMTLRELLARLREKEHFDEGESALAGVADHLEKEASEERTPYYIRALVAVGAWVAAGFFVAFLIASNVIGDESEAVVWGLVFIAAATVLRRFVKSLFPVQLALALSVAGHAMVLFGVFESFHHELWPVPLVAAVLSAVLYPLYRDTVHRFLSTLLVTGTLAGWFLSDNELHHCIHLLVIAEVVGAGVLFTRARLPRALRPLAYGLAVSLCMTATFVLIPREHLATPWWPSSVVLALGLVWLYQWIAGGPEHLRDESILIAVVATLVLGAATPGLLGMLAALGLVALGHARDDRMLTALGLVFMPVFIVGYYYSLNTTLIVKSGVLFGSGAVLLVARAYLGTRPWATSFAEATESARSLGEGGAKAIPAETVSSGPSDEDASRAGKSSAKEEA